MVPGAVQQITPGCYQNKGYDWKLIRYNIEEWSIQISTKRMASRQKPCSTRHIWNSVFWTWIQTTEPDACCPFPRKQLSKVYFASRGNPARPTTSFFHITRRYLHVLWRDSVSSIEFIWSSWLTFENFVYRIVKQIVFMFLPLIWKHFYLKP
jgi:hypothetical protein